MSSDHRDLPEAVRAEIDALDVVPNKEDIERIARLAMREAARECAEICDGPAVDQDFLSKRGDEEGLHVELGRAKARAIRARFGLEE